MTVDTAKPIESAETLPSDWWSLAVKTQELALNSVCNQAKDAAVHIRDPFDLVNPYLDWLNHSVQEPLHLAQSAEEFWSKTTRLYCNVWCNLLGMEVEPVIEPDTDDRRFRDSAWSDHPCYDFIKQFYLLYADLIYESFNGETTLGEQEAAKLRFFTQLWIDAMAPTNFAATNPSVTREAIKTNGESLVKGYRNFLRDWERSGAEFKVSLSDPDAFELGRNIATTAGKVIFQNEFIQLIQYLPKTDQVLKEPLLVIPPWINKYYILDLRPENSFIKWLVAQGHTVFVVSWVNPDETYADKTFEHYLVEGVYAAVSAIEQATGESKVNAVGYCLGGTLLAAALAHMAVYGDERIQSATFLTTLIDFSDPGEIRHFIDEQQIQKLEARMSQKGYLEGGTMASAFSLLRANDLIWSAVINQYLMGKEAPAFDLLHWNADSTRMPEAMHSFYLRNMYLENLLSQPGGLELAGESLDISQITIPVYFLSTVEDHIAPWHTTYVGAQLFSGPVRFVLGGSGHIAGVINPPDKNKYQHYIGQQDLNDDADDWLKQAKEYPGSWWPDWQKWIGGVSHQRVTARHPEMGRLPVIEDAPGAYAKQRIDQ